MRFVALTLLCSMTACVGKVDGKPWADKADKAPATVQGDCMQVHGSKYTVCGVIDGQFAATASTDSTGTSYAVRGGRYAQ